MPNAICQCDRHIVRREKKEMRGSLHVSSLGFWDSERKVTSRSILRCNLAGDAALLAQVLGSQTGTKGPLPSVLEFKRS